MELDDVRAAFLRLACGASYIEKAPSRVIAHVLFLVAAAALPAAPAWAAKWDVVTGLVVEETYSDNIALSPRGTENGDWVTMISPRASVHATGDRFRFDAEYRPELYWWANESATRALHFYDAGGTAEFIKRTL